MLQWSVYCQLSKKMFPPPWSGVPTGYICHQKPSPNVQADHSVLHVAKSKNNHSCITYLWATFTGGWVGAESKG